MGLTDQHEEWRQLVLASYGDELAEGAADFLREGRPTLWNSPPGRFDEELAGFLETPAGRRCLNPKFQAPESETPLDRTLRRLPLSPEARAVISRTKQLDWGHLPERLRAKLASEFARRPESSNMLSSPPGRPASEQRVLDVVNSRFYSEVPTDRREAVAAKLSREFGGILDENLLVEKIADRLSHQASADHYGTRTVPRDDPRLRAVSVAKREDSQAQKRGEDGRFVRDRIYGGNPL
jgi:hypothetical protein